MPEVQQIAPLRSHLSAPTLRAQFDEPAAGQLLDRAARLAALALRAPLAVLGVVEPRGLRIASRVLAAEPWQAYGHLPLESTLCRLVVDSGAPLVIEDVALDPAASAIALSEDLPRGAYCGVPLLVDDEVVAVLSVYDGRPREWSDDDVALMGSLADTVLHDLAALSAATRLSLRETRYRRLFEESLTPLFVLSVDGFFLEANRALEDLLGRPRDELRRMRIADIAVDREMVAAHFRELATGSTATDVEIDLLGRNAARLSCLLTASASVADDGALYHGALRDMTAERLEQEALLRRALHDALTGLPNRIVFMDRLERLLSHSKRRPGTLFAVLFLDLDKFKQINDTHGHLVGDQLLIAVARRLESCVRQEDTVARIGGDEFAILLDTVADAAAVTLVVDRIREALREPFSAEAGDVGACASIGIALSLSGYEHAEDLLRDADTAMYRAKAEGRDGYVMFDADMHKTAVAQRQLEDDLREAVRTDRLAVHYHPVVELEGGAVTGLEALIRWPHPERGILLPADFMPLAEQTGLIVEMGWWVLRESCRQLRAWQLEYPDAAFRLTMSVNLSAKQFVHPELVERIDAILAETQLDPNCLRLDLTEAVVMNNTELAAKLLRQLRDRSIQICIDDFGTGYSSLRQLSQFPISTLKIDRSFISGLGNGGHEVVQTIIALGRSMAIDAVAEGVETPEQLEQLRRLGTRFAQGFLFSLPLDSTATAAMLEAS
ncbi:MAG TPA: EAL domain-containing protein [Longimicrobiales bacterium]|nr:EAL domain-containing protein [Longimicrobiales bacterium]